MNNKHLPNSHPNIPAEKIGVLLINLGTPDGTDYVSVRRYLSEFLSDPRVIDYPKWLWQPLLQGVILTFRPFKSGHAYAQIWNRAENESPLKTITRAQCDKINTLINNNIPGIEIEWAMRYGNPSTREGLDKLLAKGCRRILLFALYPQYSACTTATAYDKAFHHLKTISWQPAIRTASPWHDDPAYIKILAQSVRDALAPLSAPPEHIIASFHGLPQRYLTQGDPYHCHCLKTARLTREALEWPEERWSATFQSRFGAEEWLQPYTDKTIEKLAKSGVKRLAILSPAFVSECIETLEEINIGLREQFLNNGGEEFTYISCLNDSEAHINFLTTRIMTELAGWLNNTP